MTTPLIAAALIAAAGHGPQSGRVAFVCPAGDHVATVIRTDMTLVYRSMRRGGIELQIPAGSVSHMGYSGGGELQAVFRNGPWTYVVYQRTVRTGFSGRNQPAFEAGVDVLRSGRVVARRPCDDADTQFDEGMMAGLPEGWFVDH